MTNLHGVSAALAAALVAAGFCGAATAGDDDDVKKRQSSAVWVSDDDGKEKRIEVEIVDGKPRITIDGKEIDASTIDVKDAKGNLFIEEGGKVRKIDIDGIEEMEIGAHVIMLGDGKEGIRILSGDELDGTAAHGIVRFGPGQEGEMHFTAPKMEWVQEGESPKVMLGVHMGEPGEALVHHFRLDPERCTMIMSVVEDLPADRAGLTTYDVILGIGDADAGDAETIQKVLGHREPGDEVTLRVIQAGEKRTVRIELDEYDVEKLGASMTIELAPFMEGGEFEFTMPEFDADANVFFVPDDEVRGRLRELPEMARPRELPEGRWFRTYRQRGGEGEGGGEVSDELEQRLDRLTDRLRDLERMLERLLERDR
jgi:hypothetical protein